ncbi:Hypothetical predicted protein [Cloeon dipterum]|uniref:Uncharacterized protein n=1 Tax=Cloeon dipterum TaxID=197152 RepID=A0A8S1D6L4_9INSE|nr:Hypothetical predicted protein [Cloeon dipterum]
MDGYQSERQPLLGGQTTFQYMRPRARRMVIRRMWSRVLLELRGGYSRVNQRYLRKVNRPKDFAPMERKDSILWAKMLAQCSSPYTTDGQFTHDMAIKAIESGGLAVF